VLAHGDSVDSSISLSDVSREDTGHAIFHSDTVAGIACASCHLEGDSDGIVWTIPTTSGVANLRTLSLLGTVAGTAPYHWQGEITDVPALLDDVYSHGMNGPKLDVSEKQALTHWLEALSPPARQAPTDVDAAARGQSLFEGTAGCSGCHAGDKMTDNLSHDVGTFAPLQTPSLVGVGTRSPLLHDGCALTLRDRFSLACRADTHGATTAPTDVDDLVAYLETL
jgi:mono/diheme cytochrome c family protein